MTDRIPVLLTLLTLSLGAGFLPDRATGQEDPTWLETDILTIEDHFGWFFERSLALSGDSDPIVPPAQAHLIAEKVPGADLNIIQGGGHILFAERPAAYRRALGDWLHKTSV